MSSVPEENITKPENNVTRDKSTIEFPYGDLEGSEQLVRAINAAGGGICESEQLAAQLGMEAKGGGFRLRILSAKTFDLISYERGGRISLTEKGKRMLDPEQERSVRAESFLAVPLYARVYEDFKGRPLPPIAGLDRAIVQMGVGEKVKEKARQVMMRSAKHAGFLEMAPDRLTKPVIRNGTREDVPPLPDTNKDDEQKRRQHGNNGGSGGGTYHPFIEGLLKTLPPPETDWPVAGRIKWLQTAAGIFSLIYKGDDDAGAIKIGKMDT